jgi:hypothetical protein
MSAGFPPGEGAVPLRPESAAGPAVYLLGRRAAMGRRGQEIVAARFSVERMVEAIERLLLGLLDTAG